MLKVLGWVRLALCLAILGSMGVLTKQIAERSAIQQVRKYDNADINHMKYSLFNINMWKKQLAQIVAEEIQGFKVDDESRETLKKHLEAQLDVLIDKVNEQIRESNRDSTRGWIKLQLMDMLVDVKAIKDGIPVYADTIVNQVTDEDTQKQFKLMVRKKISQYLARTYQKDDTSETDVIVARAGAKTLDEARAKLASEVPPENERLFELSWALIALGIGLFSLAAYHRGVRLPPAYFFVCWGGLLLLLYAGVTSPMIDMDARVTKFGFVLLGHEVKFEDLNVYYQSKSIWDVFWLMISHERLEMRLVGVLLVLFSVVFPVAKMTVSVVYYYNFWGLRENGFVRVMVLKSGKWSMADVMAVAVLMAYIGFNGMISTQLVAIGKTMPGATFISTNGTTLQFGLYIFVTYVILAMLFSIMISRSPKVASLKP